MASTKIRRKVGASTYDTVYPTADWSNIDNKPSTFTPTSHTHGQISNTGAITASVVTPGDTDTIVITDSSDNGILKRGITIGTGTTTFLRNDGTWATPDATTIDGVDSSQIVYGQNTTKTNNYSGIGLNARMPSGFYDAYGAAGNPTADTWYHVLNTRHHNVDNNYQMQIAGNFFNSSDVYYRISAGSDGGAWHRLWHSGNDGASSGLDADLLDGNHASAFALASHTHDDRYYTETEVNNKTHLKSNTDNRAVNTIPNDYNAKFDIKGLKQNSTIGITGGSTYSALLGIRGWADSSGGDAHELAFDGGGGIYHRYGSTTSWNAWSKLWSSGNDGSGSGLDADLLDNKHASDFILTTAIGAANGVAPLDASSKVPLANLPDFITGASRGFYLRGTISGNVSLSGTGGLVDQLNPLSGGDYENCYGYMWVASSTVTLSWTDQTTLGPNYTYHILSPGDEGDTTSPVTLEAGDMVVFTKYTDAGGDGNDFEFTFSIINSNDPRFANYLPLSGGTMTGTINGRTNTSEGIAVATQGTPGIEMISANNAAAFMTFHKAGHYAVRFGLDTDNQLKVGGWSMGASAYKLWHEGNDGSGSTLDADLLDGLHGSSYLVDDGWNTSPGQDANTQPNMKADFTYANNAPWYGSLISFGAGGYQMQLNSAYVGGSNFSFRTRNGDNATWNPWREIIHTENIGSQSVNYANSAGTANNIDGIGFSNRDSGNPVTPDNSTINGLGYTNGVSLLGQSDGGLYTSTYSANWIHQIFGDFRTGQIAIRGKNAGAWQAWRTVLDSSNVGTYAFPKSGNWLGDLGSNGFTREHGVSMTGGSEFVVLSKSGQGYTLVDGSYFSYEAGGFFTSSTSAYGDLTGFKSTAANTVNFTQFDGGSAVVQVNGNTVWHKGNLTFTLVGTTLTIAAD